MTSRAPAANLAESTASTASTAASYDRFFVPAIGAPVAADLMELAALEPGERVLDVACGTGVVARMAAEQVGGDGRVAALDINPDMLDVARDTAPARAGIEWHRGDAESMPFPDASFDVVTCQMGLQFIPDRLQALREMRRVLAPGGRLALNVPGAISPAFGALSDALGRHIGDDAARFARQVFSIDDPDELRTLVVDAGFGEVAVDQRPVRLALPPPREFLWQYIASTPLAGHVARADAGARLALEQDVLDHWQALARGGEMKPEQVILATTARR